MQIRQNLIAAIVDTNLRHCKKMVTGRKFSKFDVHCLLWEFVLLNVLRGRIVDYVYIAGPIVGWRTTAICSDVFGVQSALVVLAIRSFLTWLETDLETAILLPFFFALDINNGGTSYSCGGDIDRCMSKKSWERAIKLTVFAGWS